MQVQSCIQDTSAVQRARMSRRWTVAARSQQVRLTYATVHTDPAAWHETARRPLPTPSPHRYAARTRPHTTRQDWRKLPCTAPAGPTCPSQVQLRSAQPGTGTTPRTHDSHTASHATRSPQPPHRYPPRPHTTQLQRRAPWPRWCHSRAQVTRVPGGRHSARRAGCTKPSASQNNAPHTSSEK